MRRFFVLLAAVGILLGHRSSFAGEIDIRTVEGTPWGRLIQQIQDDVASQGRVFTVQVVDGDSVVHCGEYELHLDPVASSAFSVEACDPTTDATALRLTHRGALFEPGDVVPRARRASIGASISRRGHVEGGGAPPQAGSKLWCTVALQPYLWDGLRGEPRPLMPDRFVLRPIEKHVHAAPDGAGWIARGESRFGLRFHYDVVDVSTGKTVLENEATLTCADGPADSAGSANDGWNQVRERRPDRVDMSAYDAWKKVNGHEPAASLTYDPAAVPRMAPPWWIAIDAMPVTPAATAVASMLIRPISNTILPDGTRGSTLYGSAPAVFGGTTLGFSMQREVLFVPFRLTVAGDANALVLSGMAGVGAGWNIQHNVSLYGAPALRVTGMGFSASGWLTQVDGAFLVGVRRRFWGTPKCPAARGGFEAFFEAAAPIGTSGPWLVSAGISNSFGPGGGYPWIVPLAKCKMAAMGR